MHLIKPPVRVEENDLPRVFLAGSIEMGSAVNWQERIEEELKYVDFNLYNPRRDDWDSSWVQSIDNPQFKEQVDWELDHIDDADLVVFYFDPNTKSPITLMELGIVCGDWQDVIVCCPEGFWRKGNVDILCARNDTRMVDTLDELIEAIRAYVAEAGTIIW